ncbi:MAG: hypothetical protein LLF86_00445, partial [Nitrospiraceae bacterium]|nr:hypothetical protein [Nitrospiraceae bacterium]
MKIINGLPRRGAFKNPVVTIGNFDGVHIGHQKIFRELVKKAAEINGIPVVLTFCPHPMTVLFPEKKFRQITTFEVKCSIAKSLGIKALVCINFNKEFAAIDSETFIKDILAGTLGAKWVVVGNNCSFGKGKTGSPDLLRRRGKKYGFSLKVVRYATALGKRVSSTRVRNLITKGDVSEAALTLGRAYHIEGIVVRGTGRGGPLLHTPTANLQTESRLIPKEGVYAARV